jgi:hypothetical protein
MTDENPTIQEGDGDLFSDSPSSSDSFQREIDDLLSDEGVMSPKPEDAEDTLAEGYLGNVVNESRAPAEDNGVPNLRGTDYPMDYLTMAKHIQDNYASLPRLRYEEIYSELEELSVPSCPTPTLQIVHEELQRVQAAKDRLSEIFINVLKNHTYKKRAVDILTDSWQKYASAGSADKRKGDAAFRLAEFSSDFAENDALLKTCSHILKNLDSMSDNLSRRITIFQLTLKINDVGRTSLPDFDYFSDDYSKDDSGDNNSEKKSFDPSKTILGEESAF